MCPMVESKGHPLESEDNSLTIPHDSHWLITSSLWPSNLSGNTNWTMSLWKREG